LTPDAPAPVSLPVRAPSAPQPAHVDFRVPIVSYVAAGVGVLGLGAFGYFRAVGSSDYEKLRRACGITATCSGEEMGAVSDSYLYSNVALGVGAAGLIAAVTLAIVVQPSREGSASGSGLALTLGPARADLQLTF
jgi:hypothetical protein